MAGKKKAGATTAVRRVALATRELCLRERDVLRAAMAWSNAEIGDEAARSKLALACLRLDSARWEAANAKRAARKAGR